MKLERIIFKRDTQKLRGLRNRMPGSSLYSIIHYSYPTIIFHLQKQRIIHRDNVQPILGITGISYASLGTYF
jgi:hypothetical protein